MCYFDLVLGGSHWPYIPYLCRVEFHIHYFLSQEKEAHETINASPYHITLILKLILFVESNL
jgi:hypothetical protein